MPTASASSVTSLRQRDRLYRALRADLHAADFVEVTTPVRIRAPALEEHIDAEPAGDAWLRTSPELQLKRLLGQGAERIFQLGPCFRLGERGRRHHPEFTMLEWYWVGADYTDLQRQTLGLLRVAATALWGGLQGAYAGTPLDFAGPAEVLTVEAAFQRYAGMSVLDALRADRFELVLVEQVEPHLGRGRPTFLTDYPIALGALAREKPGDPTVAERWELYLAGIELANAYSELIDPVEQRRRFALAATARHAAGRAVYPLDDAFLAMLDAGQMPPCAGCALGVDRLLMILTGAPTIADVLATPE